MIDRIRAETRAVIDRRGGAELARRAGLKPSTVKTMAAERWTSTTIDNLVALEAALAEPGLASGGAESSAEAA